MKSPQTERPAETLEQIADRIAKDFADFPSAWGRKLSGAILSALRNERERCAKIAEVIPDNNFDLDHEPARPEQQIRNEIAAAIREGR